MNKSELIFTKNTINATGRQKGRGSGGGNFCLPSIRQPLSRQGVFFRASFAGAPPLKFYNVNSLL